MNQGVDSTDTPPLPIPLATGTARALERLGAGSTSDVWRVEWNGRLCALKVGHDGNGPRLASEGMRLALARSAQMPQALDAGRLPASADPRFPEGAPYLLLSLAPGVPLDALWNREDVLQLGGAVARDVAQALADLHSVGWAHGDVKPANIIVERVGSDFQCRLIDLGMAGDADRADIEAATPRYLPPEVVQGAPGDARSRDLWALGLTLLETYFPAARGEADPQLFVAKLAQATPPMTAPFPWLAPLLSPEPGARPRASWVARQAGSRPTDNAIRIERSYLALRAPELARVLKASSFEVELPGLAGQWLRGACNVLTRLGTFQAAAAPTACVRFDSLTARRQRDWLLRLIGSRIVDFPELPSQTDDALAEALCAAASEAPIESLHFAEIVRRVRPVTRSAPSDRHELSLLLGAEAPDESIVEAAEAWSFEGNAPSAVRLATACALKRRGELPRALALLANDPSLRATNERASAYARLGHLDKAALLLEQALATPSQPNSTERTECVAMLARVRLHQGNALQAASLVRDLLGSFAVHETRASIALATGALDTAEHCLQDASGLAAGAEQRARLEALAANLAQQTGNARVALESFRRAAEHAARAGALVEEATYLIGVAGCALELGESAQALAAAGRATLLFDHLERPGNAARAVLSEASALLTLGAHTEASAAALNCLGRARAVGDARCEGFCHLVLADLSAPERATHLESAGQLLAPLRDDDRLRLAARQLAGGLFTSGHEELDALDTLATASVPAEVKLDWWAARAEARVAHDDGTRIEPILAALAQLRSQDAPLDARGRAFAKGAQLAALAGDGELTRAFTESAAAAYEQLYRGAPEELRASVRRLPWVRGIAPGEPTTKLGGEQLRDLERVLAAFNERDGLRALLVRVVDALVLWTGVERGLLLLKTPSGGLAPRAARNLARHDLTPEQRQLSNTLAERALQSGECIVAIDASGDLPAFHSSVHALKLRSVLAVPLLARGETLGVVYLDDRVRRGAFGRAELQWVQLLASLAAVAIIDTRDQLLLKRAVRRARLAEAKLGTALAKTRSDLKQRTRELEQGRTLRDREKYASLVGESPEILNLLSLVDRVAEADVPVLIRGESGSGKELVARALHQGSTRRHHAFVAENCSAIPEALLESTLFGHVRGAFTGAVQKHLGLFEMADGGTLFLDEIADMSLAMQAKLLRVIESGELRKVGSERSTQVNVRVIGASHRSLEELAASGAFREDLLYRLNVITLELPALRQRSGDVPVLVKHFLKKHGGATPPGIDDAALNQLCNHSWPGNVRQLENEIRRAVVLCDGTIRSSHLSPALHNVSPARADLGLNLRTRTDDLETELISQALKQAGGNQTKAALALGVSRFGLQKMLKRLGLSARDNG
jgi:serine/threonine-protein kinase PknK